MAVYIVTTSGSKPGAGLSLREAVRLANASAEDDIIRFDADLIGGKGVIKIALADTLVVTSGGGALRIDGDVDGDGMADVVLDAKYAVPHLEVQSGAKATVSGIDFVGGYQLGEAGKDGARGTPGENGRHGLPGLTALDVPNTGTKHGEDGGDAVRGGGTGGDGSNGTTVSGAIFNRGDLTLERVGFGDNFSQALWGGRGGQGGGGGQGGAGGTGTQSEFWHPDAPLPDATIPPSGGTGGQGGNALHGADGGTGGQGGNAAGAIFNDVGGLLTLTDVTFGGRLSSGLVTRANQAIAGDGGNGGVGGSGGTGGHGGDGGTGNMLDYGETEIPGPPASLPGFSWTVTYYNMRGGDRGIGGKGGNGGDGGDGGTGGQGGSAATLLNAGAITGTAAFVTGGGPNRFGNQADAGQGGLAGVAGTRGEAGIGGYLGEKLRDNFKLFKSFNLLRDDGKPPTLEDWTRLALPPSVMNAFLINEGITYDLNQFTLDPDATVPASVNPWEPRIWERSDSGRPGIAGRDGTAGAAGTQTDTVLDLGGAGTVARNQSLVFVHGLGQSGDTLAFNIIRLGDTTKKLDLSWSLKPKGGNGVSGDDFADGRLPSGTVTMERFMPPGGDLRAGVHDREKNIIRVEIRIAADQLDEGPEAYRIVLHDPGRANTVLGTSVITGTIDDSLIGPPEIRGTRKNDALTGTGAGETMRGLAGNDTLDGRGGNDTLAGGSGKDVLKGGAGRDRLSGGDGGDRLNGGRGNDRLDGGRGNDRLEGGDGNDRLEGGRGDDVLAGGKGRDILVGGAGNDRMTGGGGADIFVFGTGRDVIPDFDAAGSKEKIDLSGVAAIGSFRALKNKYLSEVGGATVIDDGAGNTLRLTGIAIADLDRGDFIF